MERFGLWLESVALCIAVSEGVTSGRRRSYDDWKISIVSEVLMGPLRDRTMVVVHLDDALPWAFQEAIMALEAVQETPHVTLSLGVNQTAPPFIHGGSFVLHLLLFLTDPTKFLQWLWPNWKPQYLLLFGLASSNSVATTLDHEVFSKVPKLALMTELPNGILGRPRTMGVYTFQPFSSRAPKYLGVWSPQDFVSSEDLFVDRFPSFEGHTFHLATWVTDPPFLYRRNEADVAPHLAPPPSTGAGSSTFGVAVNMLDAMASKLDFKYTMTVRPPDLKWGRIENGSWVGLLGMLHRQEKNFTVNNFHHSTERLRDFDVSFSYWMEGLSIYLLEPEPLPAWLSVRRPFQPLVWVYVTATFAVVLFLMVLQERVGGPPFLGGVASTWLYLLRGAFGQGVTTLPRALGQRMSLALWYVYCLVVSIYYTSNLIAIFTNLAYPPRIHALQQLIDSKYRIGMADYGSSLLASMEGSENEVYAQLSRKTRRYTEEEGMMALVAGTHAFINSPGFGFLTMGSRYKVFNWYTLEEQLLAGHLSWYFPKHTTWKSKLDHCIQSLVEAGFIQYWYKVETERAAGQVKGQGHQRSKVTGENLVLTVGHLQGVFYILILAWAASVTVALLELLRHHCSHR